MVQANNYQQYEAFKKKQATLLILIKRLSNVISSLNMSNFEKSLKELESLVLSDSFKVLVLGEFKRGKSTFINALLEDEVLPAYARPCTAIINEVKWGESKRALLHLTKNGNENTLKPKTQEIDVNKIEDYVVITEDVSEIHGNHYDKVELFWPLELCRNGVEIIDSPGLNEHDIRQKITIDYLSTVDAVLFVFSCEALVSKSEMEVIDNILRPAGHNEMFFICNRFNMIKDREKENIKSYGISKLKDKTKPWEKRIFFISALDALEGRIEKDEPRVANSGIVEVERELENFLASDKGRIKILRPSQELKRVIQAARNVIPERESMFRTNLKTLEARYQAAQEPLNRLQTERELIVLRISNFLQQLQQNISHEGDKFYKSMSDKVDEWNNTLKPKTVVNFLSWEGSKPQIERLIKEVSDHFSNQMESELQVWQSKVLEPLISNYLERFLEELGNSTKQFLDQVDTLRLEIAGKEILLVHDIKTTKVSAIERILAAAGGLLIGGVLGNLGLAGMGAVFGYQEMAKAIIPQLLLSVAAIVLLSTNPWAIFPLMATSGAVHGFFTMRSTNKKIQEEIGKRYANKIRDTSEKQGKDIAETVIQKLSENLKLIDKGLGQEIENVREQVNSILREKQKGQDNVDEKINELQSLLKDLNDIDHELSSLIIELALPESH
ncbi:GTP-binding protein [Anabaena sp. UHCC 0253]|uniref:dynamin family protein n=1 Tax=Anabaena sp. UHCC 0253 TaxID=2590019 RepID=UPI001446CBFD|nr:dynamin family protein [Anabaena sp. UHCC 0253]MTJ51571.1 GTP-binding protein [Anabaena sp. UHCC 0253]